MKTRNVLKEPFPVEILPKLDFGSADGRLDQQLEDAFVHTTSTIKFLQNKHSIIIGHIGSGKSALFELVKTKSNIFFKYTKKCTIIPIEESVDFHKLGRLIDQYSDSIDSEKIYQLIWKLHITIKICENISNYQSFPLNKNEKNINTFLSIVGYSNVEESIIDRISSVLRNSSFKFSTKISETPISVEGGIGVRNNRKELINLDVILDKAIEIEKNRNNQKILIIIDRLDRFVAGQEYEIQRKYIESLIEIDDDLRISHSELKCRIFIRSDLFARLNFESLGYDKINDKTLRLEWTNNELIAFMSHRIMVALHIVKLLSPSIIFSTTNLDSYNLSGVDKLRSQKIIPLWVKKLLFDYEKNSGDRDASLSLYLNKSIVTKVFPRHVVHKSKRGEIEEVDLFHFLETHFKDGHSKVTPRNLLIFIKKVVDENISYYDKNFDQATSIMALNYNGTYEWPIFRKKCIYSAYLHSKKDFIRNISKVEDKWTRYFSTFLRNLGNRKKITPSWIKSITSLNNEESSAFIAYLNCIGFLIEVKTHPNPNRREYNIPIMYMSN